MTVNQFLHDATLGVTVLNYVSLAATSVLKKPLGRTYYLNAVGLVLSASALMIDGVDHAWVAPLLSQLVALNLFTVLTTRNRS